MSEKNKLAVNINGREYTITSGESRAYMLGIADLVDKKMKQLSAANPELNTALTAVLTALNLADDYVQLKRSYDELAKKAASLEKRLQQNEE